MNASIPLAVALLGLCANAGAAPPASGQAAAALDTARVYDGTPDRAAGPVYAGDASRRRVNPEGLADEEQARARARANLKPVGTPLEPPAPEKKALVEYNPLIDGARGALAGGIVGLALGGPLGLFVGAAVFGATAWGMSKIGNA